MARNRPPAPRRGALSALSATSPSSESISSHTLRSGPHQLTISESNRCHTQRNVRAGGSAASGAFVSASFVGFLSPSSRLFKTHHAGEESESHKTSGAVALLGYVQDFCPRSRLTKLYVALI